MQTLAIVIILCAVLTSIIQKLFWRYDFSTDDDIETTSYTILAIGIYEYEYDWEKAVRHMLSYCLYNSNVTVGLVIKCKSSKQRISVPIDLQHKVHVTYIYRNNERVTKTSIEKLYKGEDYIAVFTESYPCKNWDANCLDLIQKNRIITSPPSVKETATFPTITNHKGMLENGPLLKMASMSMCATRSVCLCKNFIFGTYETFKTLDLDGSMIDETFKTRKKIVIPCFPLINGRYIKSKTCYNERKAYYKNMVVGLTKYPTDSECIRKYGNVEVANLHAEFKS